MAGNNDSVSPFSIPGNIKQRFLPFVINPSAKINDFGSNSTTFNDSVASTASPQLFTYKNTGILDGGTMCLGFYPATSCPSQDDTEQVYNRSGLDKDISFKLLYENDDKSTKKLTIDDIISTIPGISIREFLPDTRLDQCINFFKDLFGKTADLVTQASEVEGKNQSEKNATLMKKIWACAQYTIGYMTGMYEKSFLSDVFGNDTSGAFRKGHLNLNSKSKIVQYIHDFPYTLYYRLQSCTTTNIYEVPAMCDGKPIMSSDGIPGWGDGSDIMGAGGFRVSGLLKKIPVIGKIAEMMLGNIGINYMPWWNAESGAKVAAPQITVKFDLFNDNVFKAVQNFVFVNTLVPSNRWVQYNMFQHSSNLYDVKIEGLNRLFACAASFEVTYEGVLRNPPDKFLDVLKAHINTALFSPSDLISFIKANNLIKIPDIYRVNMTFKSLLPSNFNNFLFTYSQNVNHIVSYDKGVKDNTFGKQLRAGVEKFAGEIVNVWNAPDTWEKVLGKKM